MEACSYFSDERQRLEIGKSPWGMTQLDLINNCELAETCWESADYESLLKHLHLLSFARERMLKAMEIELLVFNFISTMDI